jgi:hypothetical protein
MQEILKEMASVNSVYGPSKCGIMEPIPWEERNALHGGENTCVFELKYVRVVITEKYKYKRKMEN